jgi:hypothetical protein
VKISGISETQSHLYHNPTPIINVSGKGKIIPLIYREMYGIEQLKESRVFAEQKYYGHHVGDTALQRNYKWIISAI